MDSINIDKCVEAIDQVLNDINILDTIRKDSCVYVGGSLPTFVLSQHLANKNDPIVCNDIDLYTSNYVKTLHNVTKDMGNRIHGMKRTGVNVSFLIKDNSANIPVQIITSEFISFYKDVLGNYDCTMVAVGYHPFSKQFIIHQNFIDGFMNKEFICHYEKSNPKRIEKLQNRSKTWYNASLKIVKESEHGDFRPYYKKTFEINSLQDIVSPPNYVQLYYEKFNCIACNDLQLKLLCDKCSEQVTVTTEAAIRLVGKKITILGGLNGLGKIIADVSNRFTSDICVTSRTVTEENDRQLKFVLGEPVSKQLMDRLLCSDIIILNAYSTLENDEKIWTTTLDTFDEGLAFDKFNINTISYVRFLKQFVAARKEYINKYNLTHDIQMIFMDANESRFEGKLSDGKHLELNLAKTATKQIFYTNANLLASLGVLSICYDPGWLSYHGISVDKIESKSKFLISPSVSALCLLYKIDNVDFDYCIGEKKVVFDCTVYNVIKKIVN